MAHLDLVIRGGEIVTAENTVRADVGIAGGKVVQIGGDLAANQEIDASGKLLFPGGIDAHVHLNAHAGEAQGPGWVDDFTSGSAAALAGGITTLGNMTFMPPDEMPLAGLNREAAAASQQAIADFFLHPVISQVNEQVLAEIPELKANGYTSIKYFMATPRFDEQVTGYLELTRQAGASGIISLIHCEDYALMQDAANQLTAAGKTSLKFFPQSRPVLSEVVSVQRAVAFAEATNSPVYIVHLSSQRALAVCAEAQSRGVPVYVETRPLYLHLTSERFNETDGAKYVGQPPLREPQDASALWEGLRSGAIHTVCTDHAPWKLKDKLDATLNIIRLRPGVENLQTMLPMLYSEGVRSGRISLNRLIELTSANAAKLFGLYPRKGTIAPGSDADIVVFDPQLSRTVESAMLKSRADYSVYQGWPVTGWPVTTLRRGEIVFKDGEILGQPGSGKLQFRNPTGPL
jgi:dihydropyrimidinase